jgi:hypothetical protein
MVGKNAIQITGSQFAQGLCTSDYLGDGGMGTETQNINPIITQGIIYGTAATSVSGLSGVAVASCEDYQATSTVNRFVIDTGSGLSYIDNSNIVHSTTPLPVAPTAAVSDMIPFDDVVGLHAPGLYISTANDITRVTGTLVGPPSTGAGTFWTVTKSKNALSSDVPHPLLVYQNQLWIGNGSHLPNMDTSGNANNDASWTLDINEIITALGIDPQTGLMMVSVTTTTLGASGGSATTPRRNYIYLYDGYSAKPRRKIPVQGSIYSFTPYAGQVMVGIDNSIGIWNGNGVTFLRRLSSVNNLPYKHRCAVINNIFMVADGTQILAYGDIINGKKAWFPLYKNTENSNSLNIIFQQSISLVGLSYDSSTVKFINLFDTSLGAGTGIFYTNNINFERPVVINRVRVVTTGITTTAGIGGVSIVDENENTYSPTQNKFVVSSGTKYVFDFDMNYKLQTLQPKITLDTQSFGVVKIVIYYTVAE